MNVLVINASPYKRRGITSLILTPFCDGVRSEGGKVDIVYLAGMDINPCRGDLSCWFKQKNRCIQKDDMEGLVPRFRRTDVVVFATPVYCDGLPGHLKVLMDRLVVLGNPLLEVRDGHVRHPMLEKRKEERKFVLISSCGLWERDNFNPMVVHLEAFCRNIGYRFSGKLLRPHSFAVKNRKVNDILRAAKKAGRELVKRGAVPESLENIVSRPIVSRDEYIADVNKRASVYLALSQESL